MNAFRLKKQLWRRWRRWKKALWVGAACLVVTVLAWRGMRVPEEISGLLARSSSAETTLEHLRDAALDGDAGGLAAPVFREGENGEEDGLHVLTREALLQAIEQSGISRNVHLKTTYIAGEETENIPGSRGPEQLKALIEEHPAWSAWLSQDGDLWLEKRVDDLSPLAKKYGYIGVDEHGNLTLFSGPPVQEKVLKTFFQMDIGSMKSSLPADSWKQLQNGIRIQDIEEYNSVLSTFSDFARETSEQAMQSKQ